MTADVDVLVVGAGPVGLAAAIDARMAGLTVAVIDSHSSVIDKACGEGLMPGALTLLQRLGVEPSGHPLLGVRYYGQSQLVEHQFAHGVGRGVRRTALWTALSDRATQLGVERIRSRVRSLSQDAEGVSAAGVRGRFLLGADGLHSTVRKLVGLERVDDGSADRRYGIRQHFLIEPWSDLIEVHWTPTVEAYVTPISALTGPGSVGIAVLGPAGTGYLEALEAIPMLAERVADAPIASSLRGAGPFRQRTIRRTAGRVLLVGDASGYVDAITGEGIRVGLAQARAAVRCIVADAVGRYDQEWRSCTRDFRLITSGLLWLATSSFRRAIVPTAASLPRAFGALVERLAT